MNQASTSGIDTSEQDVQRLSDAWEAEAANWAAWAREPGHDSYWRFHRDQFFELLPVPMGLTVDVGCGEGRVTRDLKNRGYEMVSLDASPTLIRMAREADPGGAYELANAASLPLSDECARLVIAFMSLQDVDDLDGSISEIARILEPGGSACLAIVHPINSAGLFESPDADSQFIISGSYLEPRRYSDTMNRNGLEMTFHSLHRSVDEFSRAFEKAGLLIAAIREHPVPDHAIDRFQTRRWQRVPMFLHFKLLKLNPVVV
ncbi:MAG: class I SAM-dependent methyltransferase [Cyanobacteria bacterium]|nr:class I SAM-dependent methyltransferase [Cyanobacteriota bacterium]